MYAMIIFLLISDSTNGEHCLGLLFNTNGITEQRKNRKQRFADLDEYLFSPYENASKEFWLRIGLL